MGEAINKYLRKKK